MTRARVRLTRALATVSVSCLALTGCTALGLDEPVDPWVVANHDEKAAFHEGAGDELLNLDATAGLAKLEAFQAVGYHHISAANVELHMEYESSVDGESYVSRLFTDQDGFAFDQSHVAGSDKTYYLLGDVIKEEVAEGKSWVEVPIPDIGRTVDPGAACQLFAVSYMCALIDSWNITRENIDAVPVALSHSETGDQHFATAVSYGALAEAGLVVDAGQIDGFTSDEVKDTLVPMHLWVNPDGLVTKIEVNGVLTGAESAELSLQIGFEITSHEASAEMAPVDAGDVPDDDVYRVTTQAQLEEFLNNLAQV